MDRASSRFARIGLVIIASFVLLNSASLLASEITSATIMKVMNVYRERHSLPPLIEDTRLDAAAEDRMTEMSELGYWAHVSPSGELPFRLMRQHGYNYSMAGENLAKGFETAEVLVEAWMESEGHRANILSSVYEHVGIAVIDGATEGRAIGKSAVVIFGREMVIPIAASAR